MSDVGARIATAVGAERVGELPALPGLPVAAPRDEKECRELFALAARDALKVLPLGNASKLHWTRPPDEVDFAVSTREIAGVVDFEAGDGTITALAGTPVAELRELVAAEGLELTPDVPRPEEATLGGVIAAGQSGFDRLYSGPVRGHVLGTRVMLASGEKTRSGGRLVKNATGYDLHRLYCGSFGTLALILEVSLRLLPAPRALVVVNRAFDELPEGLEAATHLRRTGVGPRAMTIENLLAGERGAPWGLHLVLAGFPEPLELELERLEKKLGGWTRVEGVSARALAGRLRDLEPDSRHSDVLHLAAPPSRIAEAAERLFEAFEVEGNPTVIQPGVATLDLALDLRLGDPERTAISVASLRETLAPLASRLCVRGPVLGTADLDLLGAPDASFALQRRLREALDPRGLFATGRFHGGL